MTKAEKAALEKIKGLIRDAIEHQQEFVECFKDCATDKRKELYIACRAEVSAYQNVLLALNGTPNPLAIASGKLKAD